MSKKISSRAPATHGAKKVAKPRKPGRPQARGADLRSRILDEAIALFGEQGIAATTLRAIAQRAGVTPALLHYYFASKESLIDTVVNERIAPFVAVSVAPLLAPLPSPRATLRKFLETHMRNIAANPWMPRLMAREVLSEGGALRNQMQAQFSATISPKTLMLITAAQRRGEIRNDLHPMLLGLSLISLVVFPFAAAPLWRVIAQTLVQGLSPHIVLSGGTDKESLKRQMKQLIKESPEDKAALDEKLIAHTLTLIDSILEVPRAKTKH